MSLTDYLRNKLAIKLVPLLKKDNCEVCGTDKNLELHHIKQFIAIVDETLEELDLKYEENINNYSEKELNIITNIVLGKHLDIEYLTLCTKCHDELHSKYGSKKSNYIKENIKQNKNNKDKEFLNNDIKQFMNLKLFKAQQEELKELMINKLLIPVKKSHNSLGLKAINLKFQELGLNIILKSEEEKSRKSENRGQRYWCIVSKK